MNAEITQTARLKRAVLAAGLIASPASAAILSLTSGPSTLDIDTATGAYTNWEVGGTDQLFAHEFYIGIDGAAEESLSAAFGAPAFADQFSDKVKITHSGGDISVVNNLVLAHGTLGGAETSDLLQSVVIRNDGGSSKDIRFFQYVDFDLGGSPFGDSVTIDTSGSLLVGGVDVSQTDQLVTVEEAFTQSSPKPDYIEAEFFSSTRTKLEDGNADNLAISASSDSAGPGDVTWAVQWDFTLGSGEQFVISKDTLVAVVPEPGTFALLAGLTSFVWIALKRRGPAPG